MRSISASASTTRTTETWSTSAVRKLSCKSAGSTTFKKRTPAFPGLSVRNPWRVASIDTVTTPRADSSSTKSKTASLWLPRPWWNTATGNGPTPSGTVISTSTGSIRATGARRSLISRLDSSSGRKEGISTSARSTARSEGYSRWGMLPRGSSATSR